jgi:hypothetical protein
LCHCVVAVLTQVDTGSHVNYYDLLKVGVLLQPRQDLAMPLLLGRLFTLIKTHQLPYKHVYKSFISYKTPWPKANYKMQTY